MERQELAFFLQQALPWNTTPPHHQDGREPCLGSRSGEQVSNKGKEGRRQENRKWKHWLNAWACFFAEREWQDNIQTGREEGAGGEDS